MLLRGDPSSLRQWLQQVGAERAGFCVAIIFVGTGAFGAAVGWWRSETQAWYTALKLPLILLLTAGGNALLNGVLAPLLGLNLTFRQAALAVLLSFALAAAILGSVTPLLAFFVWNLPPMNEAQPEHNPAYYGLLLTVVGAIAFAGIAANLRLLQLLTALAGNATIARRLLVGWLAANLLLDARLAWIGRPYFGHPNLPVEFLRADAWSGNFFEAVVFSARALFNNY